MLIYVNLMVDDGYIIDGVKAARLMVNWLLNRG